MVSTHMREDSFGGFRPRAVSQSSGAKGRKGPGCEQSLNSLNSGKVWYSWRNQGTWPWTFSAAHWVSRGAPG